MRRLTSHRAIRAVYVTDSVVAPAEPWPGLNIVVLAPLLAAAIRRLHDSHQLMVLHSASLLSGMLQNGVSLTPGQKRHAVGDFRKILGDCVIEPNISVRDQHPYGAAASPE